MPRIKPPPDEFAARIRQILTERNLKQKEAAEIVKVDREAISGYCNNKKPNFETLIQLCRELDISPTWLLLDIGQPSLKGVMECHKRRRAIVLEAERMILAGNGHKAIQLLKDKEIIGEHGEDVSHEETHQKQRKAR